MKNRAWLLFILLLGILFLLSSIPGLRVLPVLSFINSLMVTLDWTFVIFSEWLASKVPIDIGELRYIDSVTNDFFVYARNNPVIIEFLLRKTAHIFVFFIITVALFYLLHQYIRNAYLTLFIAFIGGGLVSVLDEYRQTFVPDRYGSLFDITINMVGVVMAVLFVLFALFITRSGKQKGSRTD